MAVEEQIGSVVSGLSGTLQILFYIIIVLAVVVLCYFAWIYTRYNIKFRLYIMTKDRVLEVDDKARKIKQKGHPVRWRLLKRREDIPPPPVEAFRLTKGGKLSLTAFYTEHGSYKYTVDSFNDKEKFADTNPITQDDHAFYASMYKDSQKWIQREWTDIAREVIPYVIIFLIFVVFLAFWDQSVAPSLTLGERLIEASSALRDAMDNSQVINVT